MKIILALLGLPVGLLLFGCEQKPVQQEENVISDNVIIQPLQSDENNTNTSDRNPDEALPTISSALQSDSAAETTSAFQETSWDDLVPAEYQPDAVLEKYQEQLAQITDDDPQAMALYGQIQSELDNAPVNESMNGKKVRLAGFIAPLDTVDGKVSEFLLVPYFGACIHVPPPPVNQTVLIKTDAASALQADEVYDPIWVTGEITTQGKITGIGEAGYIINNAKVETYDE